MSASSLMAMCSQASHNGVSIWLLGNKELTHLQSHPRGVPRFNANYTYVVINQQMNAQSMGDKPSNFYNIFFWIGSHCDNYDLNFELVSFQIAELGKVVPSGAKMRFYIEFQYAESNRFFTQFKRQDLPARYMAPTKVEETTGLLNEAHGDEEQEVTHGSKQFAAIWYQEFHKTNP